MFKKLIYIQLKSKQLILSKLKNKGKKFILSNTRQINLEETDFKHGILYNPHKIHIYIKEFLKDNDLKKTKSIVDIYGIQNKNKFKKKLNILQIALCLKKAGLTIEQISEKDLPPKNNPTFLYKKDLKGQINLFKPFTASKMSFYNKCIPYSITLLLTTAISTYTTSYLEQKKLLKKLNQTTLEIDLKNKGLENKLRAINILKQNIVKNNKNLEQLARIKKIKNNPIQKLLALSNSIPKESWINQFTIDNQAKKIEIVGTTKNRQTIPSFTKQLTKLMQNKELKITKINKLKKKPKNVERLYQFKLTGKS